MRLSKLFKLGKSQYELDFVDIDPTKDLRLFLDPHFLSVRTDRWSINATRTIRSFFHFFLETLRSGNESDARMLLSHFGEPNESCLGLSRDVPHGRGIGDTFATKIFESLKLSKAVTSGLVEDLEDARIFVPGIDKDLTSDMTTNLLRGPLLEYTEAQCDLWGIPMQEDADSGDVWDPTRMEWVSYYCRRLVVGRKPLLLVPKGIVSYAKRYSAQQFHQHHALNFLQHEHLRLNSALVQRRTKRDGSERVFVTKKSIKESKQLVRNDLLLPFDKEKLANFTRRYPDVFKTFRKRMAETARSLEDEDLTTVDRTEVIDHLVDELKGIPPGGTDATHYHRTVMGILELIFYPTLISPQKEQEIHSGRKRIDIVFENASTGGFFEFIQNKNSIPCPYVPMECKNFSGDVANPELDQLAGRFSPNRGKLGFLICRSIDDMPRFIERCTDTFNDSRGVIIPITDDDLIRLLGEIRDNNKEAVDKFLRDRFREIVHG